MIEIKAKSNDKGVAVDSHMDGIGIELLAEATGLIKGLIDQFEKNDMAMEFILMATATMSEYAEKIMGDNDEDDEDEDLDSYFKGGDDLA